MSQEHTIIYEIVQSAGKKQHLFRELSEAHPPVLLKTKNAPEVFGKPTGLSLERELVIPLDPSWKSLSSGTLSLWFDHQSENYFLESAFRMTESHLLVNLQGDLFQRQKRQDFRLFIPDFYFASFTIQKKNKKDFLLEASVSDVNNSGLGLRLPTSTDIQIGDELEGALQLGKHEKVPLACLVRHRQQQPALTSVGCEIKHSVFSSDADLQKNILLLRYDVFHLNQARKKS